MTYDPREKGIHIRLKDEFPFISIEPIGPREKQITEVPLNIPVGDGWKMTAVAHRVNSPTALVQFNKSGEVPVNARLKDDHFIDPLPIIKNGDMLHVAETVAGQVYDAITRYENRGIKLTWDL